MADKMPSTDSLFEQTNQVLHAAELLHPIITWCITNDILLRTEFNPENDYCKNQSCFKGNFWVASSGK